MSKPSLTVCGSKLLGFVAIRLVGALLHKFVQQLPRLFASEARELNGLLVVRRRRKLLQDQVTVVAYIETGLGPAVEHFFGDNNVVVVVHTKIPLRVASLLRREGKQDLGRADHDIQCHLSK